MTDPLVFPRTTRLGTSPAIKSSSAGPSSKVLRNEEGRDEVAGVVDAVARPRPSKVRWSLGARYKVAIIQVLRVGTAAV